MAADKDGPAVCGECGALIGDVTAHTAWHAGSADTAAQAAIIDFLDSVDPAALEQQVLAGDMRVSPIAAALDVLKAMVAS